MIELINIFGFTGKVWEVPNIESLTTTQLLSKYGYIYYTIESNGVYYLGTRDTINVASGPKIAKTTLVGAVSSKKLKAPVELKCSDWKLVTGGIEGNGTVRFMDNEKLVVNGGQFIASETDSTSTYIVALTNVMATHQDPVIGTSSLFYDCNVDKITTDTLTANYEKGLLLIGGILFEIRSFYDYLGTGVNLKGSLSGWLPTLYKRITDVIDPYEVGLSWPLELEALQSVALWNNIIAHKSSCVISFDTPAPVSYEARELPRLFATGIKSFLCYNARPSPNRVTPILNGFKTPTKNALYPEYADVNDSGSKLVTVEYTVQDITPKEHTIKFINYEVLS